MNRTNGKPRKNLFVIFLIVSSLGLVYLYTDSIQQYFWPQKITVETNEIEFTWLTNKDTLPYAQTSINVNLQNTGEREIRWIDFIIKADSTEVHKERITGCNIGYDKNVFLTFTLDYDTTKNIEIEVTSAYNNWKFYHTISAPLIRTRPEMLSKLYITPSDPELGKDDWVSWITPNFLENLLDTYSTYNDIDYVRDNVSYSVDDYWQLPRETLRLGYGDCEDQAILLCSYLRANGVSSNDVFVVVGTSNNQGHAWVFVNRIDGWKFVEPTAQGTSWYNIIFWDDNNQRTVFYAFNDEIYLENNFPFPIT